ncbi:acyltransferase [Helicobacter canis]|uniref:UDP-3-O-[3-hydroxymyristoyl] glucosamine N-acyltransferase n=1 Tax=Helicobacter canis NCTC 12740 TaxID=1357399 RepID=V8CJM0_9HELI|nr:acyltransferase [Helicobacter canis]ETD27292.1 hypothetical protein HMPREF2087_00201 [Helicobacter canis NCTC 12740]
MTQQTNKQDLTIKHSCIRDITYGENLCVIEPVNLYECTFGDNVFIGPFVEVQSDVSIGSHCRIQSHSFICSLTHIDDHCFIGHGVMFINDTFANGAPAKHKSQWKGAHIGKNVSIGSNATILPVSICDNVVIGAGAVVAKDITESGFYIGNPARKLRDLPQA